MMMLKSKMHPEFSMPHSWHFVHCIPFFAGTLQFFFARMLDIAQQSGRLDIALHPRFRHIQVGSTPLALWLCQYILSYSQKKEPYFFNVKEPSICMCVFFCHK